MRLDTCSLYSASTHLTDCAADRKSISVSTVSLLGTCMKGRYMGMPNSFDDQSMTDSAESLTPLLDEVRAALPL